MADYTIVGLVNHNISLQFDGIIKNFPLPIVDNLYPSGDALTALLDHYVETARANIAAQNAANAVVPANDADVRALIVDPAPAAPVVAANPRVPRTMLLRLTDFTQLSDTPFTTEQRAAWATYRQALRDLPTQAGFPTTITWPAVPTPLLAPNGTPLTAADGSFVAPTRG